MKPNTTTRPDITISDLRISTDIAQNPEFVKSPDKFAFTHKVNLVDRFLPEISFKQDREADEMAESAKANLFLVHHKAIRLFVKNDGSGYRIRSIAVNPAELMRHSNQHLVPSYSLDAAFDLLKLNIEPLLAEPLDRRHIVPGHADDNGEHRASWSEVVLYAFIPGLEIACIHGLAHPLTGPAQGSSKPRIDLCNNDGSFVISFEQIRLKGKGKRTAPRVEGVSVTLTLGGMMLPDTFGSMGKTALIHKAKRLVSFPEMSMAEAFLDRMSQVSGTYLPIPPEWAGMGKPITYAKTIALLAQLTGKSVDELRAVDDEIRSPSKSTRQRLNHEVDAAVDCLKPVPVTSLFTFRCDLRSASPRPLPFPIQHA